jgi:hypothetical protein
VEEILAPEDLDAATLESRLQAARDSFSSAEAGSDQAMRAKRDERRAEAFLRIATGS